MEKSPQKYWLETYGCQMNFAESNALEIDLLHHGYTPAEYPEEASVVILNTCSVRKTAESRIWGRLGYFKHIKEQHFGIKKYLICLCIYTQNLRQPEKF